ncbi:MAG: NmrA family NAD(P)-binding protein [Gammaproteobacteria bacterium]|nr:NmrA family NAD(P)-binding protein [Gammaproteobacteria bacterium]
MPLLLKILIYPIVVLLLVIAAFDIWGALTLGKITPDENALIDPTANRVVMVFGATGSVGDGLLKAAMEDPDVKTIHVVTRSTSPRIDSGQASGRVQVHMHKDFENYDSLRPVLRTVNTVMWALGTSSLQVDEDTYTWIHVNFPIAFVTTWLEERTEGPMSFHNVTGMGTDPEGDQRWARDKGGTELQVAKMAEGTGLRGFGYRSAFVRPTSEQSNVLTYTLEFLLKPGKLVIPGKSLGQAMLEISARTQELPNGTLIDNADSIAYARAYQQRQMQ